MGLNCTDHYYDNKTNFSLSGSYYYKLFVQIAFLNTTPQAAVNN